MPNPVLAAAVARVRRTADLDDAELLSRFVAGRDADAFAALVHRHGPLVLAVCRRVTRDHHLADDAFQAAFLVFAKRAADVRPRNAVRAWLYGVAVRSAQEARTVSARRRSREVSFEDRPGQARPLAEPDDLQALDEEIAQLPEPLRTAVVLCELDGGSRKDVARRLGLAEGTLSSRLAKARKLLAARLARRGVTAPLAAAGVTCAVPEALAATVGQVSNLPVQPGQDGILPHGTSVEVARRVLSAMFLTRVKQLLPAVVVWLVLAGLAVAFAQPEDGRDKPGRSPVDLPPATGRILVYHKQHLVTVDPDGKTEVVVSQKVEGAPFSLRCARLSPDGKYVAYLRSDKATMRLHIREIGGKEITPEIPAQLLAVCWTADGRLTVQGATLPVRPPRLMHWFVDPKTGKATDAKIPPRRFVHEWFPDGKSFLSVDADEVDEKYTNIRLTRVALADNSATDITERDAMYGGGRLSPDGKKLLYPKPVERVPKLIEPLLEPFGYERPIRHSDLFVGDVDKPDSGKMFTMLPDPANTGIHGDTGHCWSPDGKRVAYYTSTGRYGDERVYRLVVAAADGSGPKTILTETHSHLGLAMNFLDWAPSAPVVRKAPVPQPAALREGTLVFTQAGMSPIQLVLPDQGKPRSIKIAEACELPLHDFGVESVALSPDGKRLAVIAHTPGFSMQVMMGLPVRATIYVCDLLPEPGRAQVIAHDLTDPSVVWSTDGSKLYGNDLDPNLTKPFAKPPLPYRSWVYDLKRQRQTPLPLPAGHLISGVSPDEKTVDTVHDGSSHVFALKENRVTPIATYKGYPGRFSPDGKRILVARSKGETDSELVILEVADRSESVVQVPTQVVYPGQPRWSPDGRRIAYTWSEKMTNPPGGKTSYRWRVNVANVDGTNPRTVFRDGTLTGVRNLDWR